jgi:hypothetical protein
MLATDGNALTSVRPMSPQRQEPVMHFVERTHKRRKWLPHEDNKLIQQVARVGKNWAVVATHLPGRDGPGCRKRYVYYLEPNIYRGAWTPEEDDLLIRSFGRYGKQWAQIAQIPGLSRRSTRSLSWRWAKLCQKKEVAELVELATTEAQARGLAYSGEDRAQGRHDQQDSCGQPYFQFRQSAFPQPAYLPFPFPMPCPSSVFPTLSSSSHATADREQAFTRMPVHVRAAVTRPTQSTFGPGVYLSGWPMTNNLQSAESSKLIPSCGSFHEVAHSAPQRTGVEPALFDRPRDGTSFRVVSDQIAALL